MKGAYKFFIAATFGLVAMSLASSGVLVVGLVTGIETGMWLFWYGALYGTLAAMLMASIAAVVFLMGYFSEVNALRDESGHPMDSRSGTVLFG